MSNTSHAPVVLVIGSDYEAIKMGPIYSALKRAGIPVYTYVILPLTSQSEEVFRFFNSVPDYLFSLSSSNDDPLAIIQHVLSTIQTVIVPLSPLIMLLQDDGAVSLAAALAGHACAIPVGHVNAGLYTDSRSPIDFEDVNRRLISILAQYHFACTDTAVANLVSQGVRRGNIFCTGNTLIDAVHIIKEQFFSSTANINSSLKEVVSAALAVGKRIGFLFLTKKEIAEKDSASRMQALTALLSAPEALHWVVCAPSIPFMNISLVPAHSYVSMLTYSEILYLIDACHGVVTNDQKLQEMAVGFGKKVIVLEEDIYSMEGVLEGLVHVVGSNYEQLEKVVQGVLWSQPVYLRATHPQDEGHAAEKIVAFIQAHHEEFLKMSRAASVRNSSFSPRPLPLSLQEKTE